MNTEKYYTEKSKFLALVLRHKPEEIGVTLDNHGWAPVAEILKGIGLTMTELERIVSTDEKQRYAFNESKTKIRANQGHSVKVDMEFKEATPPDILYHGTSTKNRRSIALEGIKKASRQYVHLSADFDTAIKVGKRHGEPYVFVVDTKKMYNDGVKFYISENNVWMTDYVSPKYFIY